jgi:predicted RNA binding protein YcfA (HicA-like mRNA interferase family)
VARLTPVDPRVMDRALSKLGFARVRQKGSHVLYRHADGRTTTVPHHKGRGLAVPLVRAILADINMSPDDSCGCSNPSTLPRFGSFAPTRAGKASNPAGLGFVRISLPRRPRVRSCWGVARVRSDSRTPGWHDPARGSMRDGNFSPFPPMWLS